jgi:phosphoribulokinase
MPFDSFPKNITPRLSAVMLRFRRPPGVSAASNQLIRGVPSLLICELTIEWQTKRKIIDRSPFFIP